MPYMLTPGSPFANNFLVFQRTPGRMVELLTARRSSIAEAREALMQRLTKIVGDRIGKPGSRDELAIRLIELVQSGNLAPGPYEPDAAEALNVADDIRFHDSLIRETKLLEDMFAGESDQSAAMAVPFPMLHFAMEPYDANQSAQHMVGSRFWAAEEPIGAIEHQPGLRALAPQPRTMGHYVGSPPARAPGTQTLDDVLGLAP